MFNSAWFPRLSANRSGLGFTIFHNTAKCYLDEYAEEDKPFFAYLSYTAPRDPLMAWLILFASDNGCPSKAVPRIGSMTRWSSISHDVGHFIDFMPTFAEIADWWRTKAAPGASSESWMPHTVPPEPRAKELPCWVSR